MIIISYFRVKRILNQLYKGINLPSTAKEKLIEVAQKDSSVVKIYLKELSYDSNRNCFLFVEVLGELKESRALPHLIELLSTHQYNNHIKVLSSIVKISETTNLYNSMTKEIVRKIRLSDLSEQKYVELLADYYKSNPNDYFLTKFLDFFKSGDILYTDDVNATRENILKVFKTLDSQDSKKLLPSIKIFFSENKYRLSDGLKWGIMDFIGSTGEESEIPFFMNEYYIRKREYEKDRKDYRTQDTYQENSWDKDDNDTNHFDFNSFFEENHIFHTILFNFSKRLGYKTAKDLIIQYEVEKQKEISESTIDLEMKRLNALENISKNYDEMSLDDLARLLEFRNSFQLQKWAANQQNPLDLVIKGNKAFFLKHQKTNESSTCFHCGRPVRKSMQKCPYCKNEIITCIVCNKLVSFDSKAGKCSYCEVIGHLKHLQEMVKTQGKCKNCGEKLHIEEITQLDGFDKKNYT